MDRLTVMCQTARKICYDCRLFDPRFELGTSWGISEDANATRWSLVTIQPTRSVPVCWQSVEGSCQFC